MEEQEKPQTFMEKANAVLDLFKEALPENTRTAHKISAYGLSKKEAMAVLEHFKRPYSEMEWELVASEGTQWAVAAEGDTEITLFFKEG